MDIALPFPFTKMSGTGNDFILVDNRAGILPAADQAEFARRVCRRRFAVGADGLICVESSERADFSWQFYNSDGSRAEMCGNGARCAARFAFEKGIAPPRMRFETLAGVIEAEVKEGGVRVQLTRPHDLRHRLTVRLDCGTELMIHALDTGVPHAVIFHDDVTRVPVTDWGRFVRRHALFQPAGSNVNFVGRRDDGRLMVRTYERGVEDETMACGTGAVAAAVLTQIMERSRTPVEVITSGGDRLVVDCLWQDDPDLGLLPEKVYLTGPADLIYEGMLQTL